MLICKIGVRMLAWWNNQWGIFLGVAVISASAASIVSYTTGSTGADSLEGSVLATGGVTALTAAYVFRPFATAGLRRVTALLEATWKRVTIVCLALATAGYAGLLAPLTPITVVGIGAALAIVLPVWFWLLARRTTPTRTLVVGDDPSLFPTVARSLPSEPIGIVSPTVTSWRTGSDASGEDQDRVPVDAEPTAVADGEVATDGGVTSRMQRIGGLSRLESVLRRNDVDTVALAFAAGDRQECFGVLQTCHDYGVDVLVHESLADGVLTGEAVGDALVRVDLEPIPWYSRVAKRGFDVVFAAVGLFLAAPVILVIAIAIKLDSPGPVLYSQSRTSELGGTFPVCKFRSMLPESENANPGDDDDRITRVGYILRRTHLDELPQLWSILAGDMSVVGPRAAWTEEDYLLEREVDGWSQRWCIKPGLTGLAQIRNVDSTNGKRKLECDLEYVEQRSFLFDLWIVCLQILTVLSDVWELIRYRSDDQRY